MLYKSADLPYNEAGVAKWLTDEGKEHVKVIRDQLAALPSFDKESIEHVIHSYVESLGVKFKMVAQPVRVAITGVIGGPGLPEFMLAIGKDETLARMDRGLTL